MSRNSPSTLRLVRLTRKVCRYLPPETVEGENRQDAGTIMNAPSMAIDLHWSWNEDEELEKLKTITQCIRKIKISLQEIEPLVMEQLVNYETPSGQNIGYYFGSIFLLDEYMAPAMKRAKRFAQYGEGRLKANLRAIAVVIVCGDIWRRRTGKEPPKEVRNNRLPKFGKFVKAVFEELRIGSEVNSALRAARLFTANQKKLII